MFCQTCGKKQDGDCECGERSRSRERNGKDGKVLGLVEEAGGLEELLEKAAQRNRQHMKEENKKLLSEFLEESQKKSKAMVDELGKELRSEMSKEIGKLRADVLNNAPPHASAAAARVVPSPTRTRSVGSRPSFTPKEVYVQGFFDWSTGVGAIDEGQVEELVAKLLSSTPQDLKDKFRVDDKYKSSCRRVTFVSESGGEACWKLREKILEAIERDDIKQGGKVLKVRVQNSPDDQVKRAHYWRAVDALRGFAKEDVDFILVPKSYGIHEAHGVELMGSLSEAGFTWDEAIVKQALPSINFIALKKATLNTRRQR